MKKFFTVVWLLLSFNCYSQKQFELSGVLSGSAAEWIYLQYSDYDGTVILDSAHISRGLFSFSGQVDQPSHATLKLNRYPIPDEENLNIFQMILMAEKMDIKVTFNAFRNGVLTGSKVHQDFVEFQNIQLPFSKKYMALRDSLLKMEGKKSDLQVDKNAIASLKQSIKLSIDDLRQSSYKYIDEHPGSWVSAHELNMVKSDFGIDSVRYLYTRLEEPVKQTREAKNVLNKITVTDEARSSIGRPAADFSRIDVNGATIFLSDFRGRYILLDFWGSWCGPCREGNPHLIELYNKYSRKQIEFLGIACQDQSIPWRKAIEKDGIGIWKHILDLDQKELKQTEQKKTIAERYAVNSYPTKILIDRAGTIIGRFHGGDDKKLDAMLRELLK